jgi:uncharacterized repeat protein (TIGR01451 family)
MIVKSSCGKQKISAALTMRGYAPLMRWLADKCSISTVLRRAARVLVAFVALIFSQTAFAQTYVNGTDDTIDGTTTCTAPLEKDFVVGDSYTVGDVNLGFFATHSWRGDIQLTLRAPDGTEVQLVDPETGSTNGDNLNVLLDDSHLLEVNSDDDTAAHSTAAPPPFANNFFPNAPLSAFNGVASAGTWTLEICDAFPGADNGTFLHAELYLSPPEADLSLTKSVSNGAPFIGDPVVYTLTLSNAASPLGTATGIVVSDALPAGVTFDGALGDGSYDDVTGEWTIASLAPGSTVSIDISVTVTATAGATVVNAAEIIASSVGDPDSTVANGPNGEDDYDTASFTVDGLRAAGTPPTLFCPNGNVIFDWNAVAWTAGDENNTYPLDTLGDIEFTITNPGTYFTSATYGGQSPTRQNVIHGGFGTGEFALAQIVDLPTTSDVVTTVIDLPTVMNGAQFRIFDIDYSAGQFADRVEVIGYNGVTEVIPTLTNGISNYVIGNQAFGDGLSADAQPNGNIVITFDAPIDRIEILYGNHSLGSPTPGLQGISLHDINFCIPNTSLSVTKVSSIIGDRTGAVPNQKAIPGSLVEYTFSITNPNPISVQNVTVTDFFPVDLRLCFADLGGQGPVAHTGMVASGLTYNFVNLNDDGDNVEFTRSDPGDLVINWDDDPTLDADGCDDTIRGLRVTPGGSFTPGQTFTLRTRFLIDF